MLISLCMVRTDPDPTPSTSTYTIHYTLWHVWCVNLPNSKRVYARSRLLQDHLPSQKQIRLKEGRISETYCHMASVLQHYGCFRAHGEGRWKFTTEIGNQAAVLHVNAARTSCFPRHCTMPIRRSVCVWL